MRKSVLMSLMMFLQFMMLPVWFVPMLPYVQTMPGGAEWAVWCGFIMGFGTFSAPLFGMFADRLLNAERVLALSCFVSAALLGAAFLATSPAVLFALLLAVMIFYMPTWSLTATIGMAHLDRTGFARIRVFGTLGWVASGAFSVVGAKAFGLADFDSTRWIFAAGASVALALGVLSFALPPTPPAAKGFPLSPVDALGLRAVALLKEPAFRRFALLLLLAMVPFQWYNVYCAAYLKETGFRYLTLTVNLGQVGEIGFMLLVPWIIGRIGFRKAALVGLAALAFRNACFLLSSGWGLPAFDFGGILIHGLIFGIFVVGSQMHVNEIVPADLRGQAQGLVNLITSGLGVFASNALFAGLLGSSAPHAWFAAYAVALGLSVALALLFAFGFRGRE